MRKHKNIKLQTWQDVYYDGRIDSKYESFDEDTQRYVELTTDDGWDKYEDHEEDDVAWDD